MKASKWLSGHGPRPVVDVARRLKAGRAFLTYVYNDGENVHLVLLQARRGRTTVVTLTPEMVETIAACPPLRMVALEAGPDMNTRAKLALETHGMLPSKKLCHTTSLSAREKKRWSTPQSDS